MLSGAEFDALGDDLFARVVAAGVDWVQVREREREGRALLALVTAVMQCARSAETRNGRRAAVLVNRRIDVALAAGAAGVHLGFDGLPPALARPLLGTDAIISTACHAPAEVDAAQAADAAHLAPIFAPLSKPASRPALGLAALERAARGARGVIAQGGVTAENAGACIAAGARGVAVTGTILHAGDPAAAAAELRAALDRTSL